MGEIIFITGTDTGVGKTVLTALLLQHLRAKKINALAMKPFCTGDRGDVELLQKLQPGELSDSEVNPYFFDQPVAPFVAAKELGQKIQLPEVIEKITNIQKRCDLLLVEGAGGVMVPIGENLFIRDLIRELRSKTIVATRNRLGTLNHTLLSILALQDADCEQLAVVVMNGFAEDASVRTNLEVLESFLKPIAAYSLPFLGENPVFAGKNDECAKKIKKTLEALTGCA